eukprot:COSAG02_NODE_28410_length_590_cov_0.790224_2_plen_66_part_01
MRYSLHEIEEFENWTAGRALFRSIPALGKWSVCLRKLRNPAQLSVIFQREQNQLLHSPAKDYHHII